MIDRRPAQIVQCKTVGDVQTAVRLAVSRDLPISIRGGGHNVAGHAVCDGGVMIDLSPMRGVQVDVTDITAVWANVSAWMVSGEGGVRWLLNVLKFCVSITVFWTLGKLAGRAIRRALALDPENKPSLALEKEILATSQQ